MPKQLDFLALLIYCAFIYWLSDQSKLPTPNLFENEDKLHHYLAYFVMGICAWRASRHLFSRRELVLLATIVFGSLFGVSDEWHQSFVVGRNVSALDWLADTIGSSTAGLAAYYWRPKKKALGI